MRELDPTPLDTARHDRSLFDCGNHALDRWLVEQAGQSQRRDGSRTYVLCDDEDVVIGYYSLCASSLAAAEAPVTARLGRHPIPAVLLARLAVDQGHQGRGVGSVLLLDALVTSVRVAEMIGARLLLVDTVDAAAAEFYSAHGFGLLETAPETLFLLMKDIRKTLYPDRSAP